jgi:DNA modification methylase
MHTLHLGDCLDVLKTLPDNSIDAIVTDPPYGLAFMGKKWDYDVPSEEVWRECLRVLKPGGHLLAFAGTRTQHRMAVRIEDAGFEIRDMIAWVYGSGFPKSHDVSKAIDKAGGDALAWRAFSESYAAAVEKSDMKHADIDRALGIKSSSCYWARTDHRGGMPPRHHWEAVGELLGLSADFERLYDEAEREVVGTRVGVDTTKQSIACAISAQALERSTRREFYITAPATEAAKQWQGWGTALKPALEPITVARKPLTGTVAANVLEWGTGAINVDGSRIPCESGQGRFPANLIHDGSEEAVLGMGESSRYFYCAKASKRDRDEGCEGMAKIRTGAMTATADGSMLTGSGNERTTARANHHPTVKPTDLMRYLCRLVTPPNGTVLDPFMGSGSTGKAAVLEGFDFIGIEREAEYIDIARARIEHAINNKPNRLL